MQTIEIRKNFKIGFDELIQGIERLNAIERKSFLSKINQIEPPTVQREAELLLQIKEIIPASVVRRFKQLQNKMHNNTIKEKEQSEMLLLTDFIEEKSAERVGLLAALAQIRKITVLELIKDLKIKDFHA